MSRQSRNVVFRAKWKCRLLPEALRNACYFACAGEAEMGTGGDQPNRGIAGRNSSADDEKERDPPSAFFDLGLGPSCGRRHGPDSGVGVETPSDQIDSGMPEKRLPRVPA